MKLALFSALLLMLSASVHGQLRTIAQEEGIFVLDGSDSVLFYRTTPHEKNGISNYIHPLWALDSNVLTLDHPEDHPHHRGIFWAWRRIAVGGQNVADSWVFDDFSYKIPEAGVERVGDGLGIRAVVHWLSPKVTDEKGQQIPFVEEQVLITIHEKKGIFRVIDFRIGLKALREGVTIAGYDNESELSGFSIRMRTPGNLVFNGASGRLTPQWPAMTVGPWVDISGGLGREGRQAGITIMSHPGNPPPHGRWNLRQKDSMQNVVFPGRKPFLLPADHFIVLRYRLVVHKGDLKAVPVDSLSGAF